MDRQSLIEKMAKTIADKSDEWDFRKQAEAALSAIQSAGFVVVPKAIIQKAVQLGERATDWNLDEVEINGDMVSTYELTDEFRAASPLKEAEHPTTLEE